MKNFTGISMLFLWAFAGLISTKVSAQTPNAVGTDIDNGTYAVNNFTLVGNLSSQYRVQATSSAASGVRKLEFPETTVSFVNVWRAYTGGQVLSGFNTMIDPITQPASARYNSSAGGSGILLPAITSGNYYTINIMHNRGNANDTMAVLETTYDPVAITSASQSPAGSSVSSLCPVTVTAVLAAAPSAGEYIYLRYSLNSFANASNVVAMTVSNDTATATIPALPGGTSVQYYILSSPVSSLLTSGQASGYYDCLTLNFNNNTGANYAYNVTSTAVPSVTAAALHNNFCSLTPVADTLIASPSNAGVSPSYQWYKNGSLVAGATGDTLIDPALNNNDSIWVVMTGSIECAVPDTSNTIYINLTSSVTSSVSIAATQTSMCVGSIDTFSATPVNGGSPSYQWYKNGNAVGTNNPVYIDPALNNNDSVYVVMISSLACATQPIDTSNSIKVIVTPVPVSGTLTGSPSTSAVCNGALVSATATAGSGGTGSVADILQYRYDGGTWQTYTSGTNLTTGSHTSVDIQTYRTATGSGCTTSSPVMVSWTVAAQPVSGTLHPSPPGGTICSGDLASATLTAGVGGAGTIVDVLEYRVDGGAWQAYTAGTGIATVGHTTLDIRTYRTASGSNCNQSTPNVTSWVINPRPVNTIGTAPVNQCGGNITLDAGNAPGSSYLWSNGSTNEMDTFSTSGVISVIVTNSYGCADTFSKNSYIKPLPIVNLGPTQNLCADSTILDAGNPGDTYAWTGGSTGEFLTVHSSGSYTVTVTDTASQCSASASVQVTLGIIPVINLGHDTMQCGGSINLSAKNPGATYLWSTGDTAFQITVSTTGNYSVTVTGPTGCTASASILVNIYSKPNLGADITDSICPASRANLYDYYINSGLTLTYSAATPSSVDSGTYTVIGTNSNGCTDTALITIIYRQKPNAGGNKTDSICPGFAYNLTTLYPDSGYVSYVWSTSTPSSVAAGSYMLVVADASGCTDTAIAAITQRIKPNLGGNKTDSVCRGYTYNLTTIYPDSGYATYVWIGVANDSAVSAGTYQLIVTNASGCGDTAYATITQRAQPIVTIPAYTNLCSTNPAFTLTGASPIGGAYSVDYVADSIFNTPVLGPGVHHVLYVYTNASGCTDSASHDVTIYPQPQIIDTIGLPLSCTGSGAINLYNYFSPSGGAFSGVAVTGNYFYPSLAPTGSDSVTYIYTDQNGCMDTAGRRIEILPSVHVLLHTDQSSLTICEGQAITFTASGAVDYQFFVNDSAYTLLDTMATFTITTLTNHAEVKVYGTNGCSSDTSDFIIIDVIPLPTVTVGPDTTIDLGQTVQLYSTASGASSLVYLWTPDSVSVANIPNPVYSGPDSIILHLKVTDTYGCTASASDTINVRIPDNITLPNIITPNGDGFNDKWVLNPKINLAGSHLIIFDRWGEKVYEVSNYANNWGGTYMSTGDKLPDGTYYYVLTVPAEDNHTYEGPINILSSK
jgi:gliding motility-associated-like protein